METRLDALVRKYPLLGKALREQREFMRFLGASLPEEVMLVQTRAFAIIDKLVPHADAHKEAVMVVVVLANSPQNLYANPARFRVDYNAVICRAVEQLRDATYNAPLTPALAQAKTAIGIAMMQETREQLESGHHQLQPHQARQIRQKMDQGAPREEMRTFAPLDVPALRDAYDREKQNLLRLIDSIAARDNTPPPPPPHSFF